jgi:sugar O-acyltransferase (sialic acid O-acetyltransferase NeuD family)
MPSLPECQPASSAIRERRLELSPERPQPLLIFPCNGNAIEALDCLGQAYRFAGFVDDTPEKQRDGAAGYRVFPRTALAEQLSCHVLAVPGSPSSYTVRKQMIDGLGLDIGRWAQVIHPSAQISEGATIGYNVLAMAGVVITSNAIIGNHVCLLPNTVVHHDSVVGDWSLVGSNVAIAGGAHIGENCYIGSGSSISNGIRIGSRALIGLGSAVIRDIPAGAIAAGNPARILRQTTDLQV